MKKTIETTLITILGVLFVGGVVNGVTILTTDSSDTLNTFRTNVNTSLQNLNNRSDFMNVVGSTTEVFFNNGGSNGADAGLTYSSSTDTLSTGSFNASSSIQADTLTATSSLRAVPRGSAPTHQEGLIFYDSGDDSLSYYNNESDVTLNIGREEWIRVRNETGSTINNGEVVRINGAHAGTDSPTVALAQSNTEENAEIAGVATHDIENNSLGYVTTAGLVRGLDTSSFSAGDKLWLSSSTAGAFTNVKPSAPNFAVSIGHVTQSNASNGTINVLLGEGRSAIYTSGSIPFASSSGALVEDNSNFFWDFGNSRLGLLTNSPSATFDINGNFQVDSAGKATSTDLAITNLASGFLNVDANGVVSTSTISNSDLTNSSVSYGGIQLSLGGSDATPAFDLSDATSLDFSAGTNASGGRSVTLNGDAIDADEETYTEVFSLSLDRATTTNNGAYHTHVDRGFTLTKVICDANSSSVSIQLDERATTTPYSAGTDILNSNLACDTDGESTTTFANSSITGPAKINVDIDSMASSTSFLNVSGVGTYDD